MVLFHPMWFSHDRRYRTLREDNLVLLHLHRCRLKSGNEMSCCLFGIRYLPLFQAVKILALSLLKEKADNERPVSIHKGGKPWRKRKKPRNRIPSCVQGISTIDILKIFAKLYFEFRNIGRGAGNARILPQPPVPKTKKANRPRGGKTPTTRCSYG